MSSQGGVEQAHKRHLPTAVSVIAAGSVSGVASTLVCHPLDTIRTRLQTEDFIRHRSKANASVDLKTNIDANLSTRKYRGAVDCFSQTVRREGVSALYKGLSGPLAAQAIYKAVMFGAFGLASRELNLNTFREAHHRQVLLRAFLCGGFAGSVNAFVVCPVELVRNRLMVQQEYGVHTPQNRDLGNEPPKTTVHNRRPLYNGALDCVRKTVASEPGGIFALWRGLSSTIMRDGPGVGMSFEATKIALVQGAGWAPASNATLLASGAMGGVGFWLVALPFDTIKSNIQTSHATESVSIRSVVSRLGIRGLYTGLGVALVRGIPGAGMVFFVQKRALDFFNDLTY
eukprot:CAMPEP_0171572320 /NCGR_PEP_ID=MMETSP0961-20121227/4068_1 /TAXON_ID=87120 /ORGANISM="Aurantiochytrium limacinum, Strain ATCCMYA-1381" /LENGTH=342 /DNA_ID=CAMNT_0012127175 /DNA_START=55 /DNA_END=1083 /DNA_ORIENTATION=+